MSTVNEKSLNSMTKITIKPIKLLPLFAVTCFKEYILDGCYTCTCF